MKGPFDMRFHSIRRGILVLPLLAMAFAYGEDAGELLVGAGTQGPGTALPVEHSLTDATGDASAEFPGSASSTPEAAPSEAPASQQEKIVLDVKWAGQETYYWCGPGSTRIALSARLAGPPSQTTLAQLMGTTRNGTNHIGLVADALNRYLEGAAYKSRPMNDPPTQAQRDLLKQDILHRIGSGYPMVANVISGWRPPGYPSGTIYHYVAIVGFDSADEKVLIADPAAEGHGGGPRWNAVPKTYWISLKDLGTWIGGKGYTG